MPLQRFEFLHQRRDLGGRLPVLDEAEVLGRQQAPGRGERDRPVVGLLADSRQVALQLPGFEGVQVERLVGRHVLLADIEEDVQPIPEEVLRGAGGEAHEILQLEFHRLVAVFRGEFASEAGRLVASGP